ncbi:Hypothetical predicted protein [Prunus dulcis]|uniref:FAF domain-containing protein n=1 Tax=Prunus dulcis TaxID=3755 RepID=A0A5E4EW58_PRUDU|nr:hypothetical protein L3X38_008928 [Prunus dulcis]VVA19716.1 Hypothetical predicted protein [Prunus dulcis]
MISDDDFSPPTSPSLLTPGDYIGMQSCVDVLTDEELGSGRLRHKPNRFSKREERSLRWVPKKMKMKDYMEVPPPIPSLARTENLPSHMPWILKRHYTTDGRLILTEEKVRHHEYFRAHRSNGRLRLQLVPLDDDVLVPPVACDGDDDDDDEEDDDEYCSEYDDNIDAYDDYDDEDNDDAYGYDYDSHVDDDDDDDVVEEIINIVNTSNGLAGKCLNINSVGTRPPSILDVPVPAIRLIKATTNGPRKGFPGQAGFGGLFRNHAGRAVSAVCEPIGISAAYVTKLAVLMIAIITAWEKGWFRYGWKQILSWSYIFTLNPFLLLGLCVLSGDIVFIEE